MPAEAAKVGVVGCGNISGAYLKNSKNYPAFEIAACADLDMERAKAKAAEHGARACTVEELLADEEISTVLNLTIPNGHFDVARAALEAGKHAYNEKPLAIERDEGRALVELAREKGLRLGCAPDTFLGAGGQTCRKLIDDGTIGEPVAATAFMTCRGHESWHPSPEFYYKAGGGPVFDMGPYYITALVNLLGPVKRVTGSARVTFPERAITSEPKNGTKITVDVPTHVAGVLDFASGVVATIIMSFDVWAASLPRIEVYGSEGSLSVPDPNGFGGPVRLWRASDREWREAPLTHPGNGRSVGVADMAAAARSGRAHRASGDLAYHVLDVMHAVHEASAGGAHVELTSTCERPEPMPEGSPEGEVPD
ncbi:MAG: Gfo/Idh/MocA family protein [Planctomycetota bacterium]|jgi:predicted dehydrogenase